jgi:hypothetical protein
MRRDGPVKSRSGVLSDLDAMCHEGDGEGHSCEDEGDDGINHDRVEFRF